MKTIGCILLLVLFCSSNAQDAFIYRSDILIGSADLELSTQVMIDAFRRQKCFNENQQDYKFLLIFNFFLPDSLDKNDFLSTKFISFLKPGYQYLDKQYLSKEMKKKLKEQPKVLKLVQVDDGVIYTDNIPVATTDIKLVYCHIPSEQYYSTLLSITKKFRIKWWFRIQDPFWGYKFSGIIGIDEQDNMWAMHAEKGGMLPLNEFIEINWDDWVKQKKSWNDLNKKPQSSL